MVFLAKPVNIVGQARVRVVDWWGHVIQHTEHMLVLSIEARKEKKTAI